MEEKLTANLLACAEAYASARGIALTTLGKIAAGDGGFFERLRDPRPTFTIRKYDELMEWFSREWPQAVRWPKGVERPASSPQREATP